VTNSGCVVWDESEVVLTPLLREPTPFDLP